MLLIMKTPMELYQLVVFLVCIGFIPLCLSMIHMDLLFYEHISKARNFTSSVVIFHLFCSAYHGNSFLYHFLCVKFLVRCMKSNPTFLELQNTSNKCKKKKRL